MGVCEGVECRGVAEEGWSVKKGSVLIFDLAINWIYFPMCLDVNTSYKASIEDFLGIE